jgi:hypothetical protein
MKMEKLKDKEVLEAIQTLIDKGVTLEMLEQWYNNR